MSNYTNMRIGISLLKDGNLKDTRPAWWVIAVAIFFVAYLFMG